MTKKTLIKPAKPIWTRDDYMEKLCTHREYYAQFVKPFLIAVVKARIGMPAIQQSIDAHFNDIPLAKWDRLAESLKSLLAIGPEFKEFPGSTQRLWNLANAVCILKEAARQIKEGA